MAERPKSRKPKPLHRPSSLSINGESLNPNPKMSRNSLLLKQTLAAIFIILAIYAFFNAFVSPVDRNHANLDVNLSFDSTGGDGGSDSSCGSRSAPAPVKVFLYDLPRKFTYGVIESYLRAREATKSPLGGDVSSLTYPGHQHSAEWWLFSDFIRDDDRRRGSPVVRVLDPEEADLFYAPFFSSLSLVVNPIRPGGIVGEAAVYSDEEMQESLVEWLEEQVYWKRNNGWDHVFICQDPNALYKVIDRVKNGILLVSDFGRLRKEQASLVKDVILPYSHRINSFNGDVGVHDRGVLLFFMGNRYRKAGGKVRDLLFQVLDKEKDCIVTHGTQSRESRRVATHGMHSSKFCLHPAGDTPSACRLFDAIVSLCVPVIVSDYVELPFEDVIDYRKIAIFVDTNNAVMPRYLVKLLRGISKERIVEYQQELRKVKRYFEYEDPNGAVNEIWRQVSQKVPYTKLMINRDKRLVRRDLTEPDCACICSNKTASIGPFNTTDGNSEF